MNLLIVVNCLPGSITEQQAFSFCKLALETEQKCALFFYDKGVRIGLNVVTETTQRWSNLLHQHATDAFLCVNAVNEFAEQGEPATGFIIAGMAQLAATCTTNTKVITFAHRTLEGTSDDR